MSLETTTIAEATQIAENFLNENYHVEEKNVNEIVSFLKESENPQVGFPSERRRILDYWMSIASRAADIGDSFSFGREYRVPTNDVPTLITAVSKYDLDLLPFKSKSEWTIWKVRLLAKFELSNAKSHFETLDFEKPNSIEKAAKLYEIYHLIETSK